MVYCANCGQPLNDDDLFCGNCGQPVAAEELCDEDGVDSGAEPDAGSSSDSDTGLGEEREAPAESGRAEHGNALGPLLNFYTQSPTAVKVVLVLVGAFVVLRVFGFMEALLSGQIRDYTPLLLVLFIVIIACRAKPNTDSSQDEDENAEAR